MLRTLAGVLAACAAAFAVGTACGQNYPSRVVRIVTTEPGTSTDVAARLIAQGLTGSLGQQVIVENRGIMAIETVAKAPPDGHSLVFYTSPLWLTPFMRDNAPWDPVRDFAPITLVLNSPYVLVAHSSLPVNSLRELIALAKAKPGELNYGSSSAGSANHLAAELFKAMAGVNIVRVPYKGAGPALSAMLAGQVQLMFAGPGAVAPHVKTGRRERTAVRLWHRGHRQFAGGIRGHDQIRNGRDGQIDQGCRHPRRVTGRINRD
jgi:tripartite-type tricarboxylate transporter receptor subunit TctC